MKQVAILLLGLFAIGSISNAQDLAYAKTVVQKLASPEFKGRGYVEKGDEIAANYISSEFEEIGLLKYQKSYFQEFSTSVNTFPKDVKLSFDDQELVPGQDFLVEPYSPSLSGVFEVVQLKTYHMLNQEVFIQVLQSATGKFLALEKFDRGSYDNEDLKRLDDVQNFLKYHPDNPAAGTIQFSR